MTDIHTCKICGEKFRDDKYSKPTMCRNCRKLPKWKRNRMRIMRKCSLCGATPNHHESQPDKPICIYCWKIIKKNDDINIFKYQIEEQAKRRLKYNWR
ncbi:hypothetical protein LCGC14_1188810 [marine sediment metagenome]|uniref:Uncharacterized protein n=1 Tax=marine sediment metagenome TaxID=412755 RepID=A0A0F9PQE8_9ZZZZ